MGKVAWREAYGELSVQRRRWGGLFLFRFFCWLKDLWAKEYSILRSVLVFNNGFQFRV